MISFPAFHTSPPACLVPQRPKHLKSVSAHFERHISKKKTNTTSYHPVEMISSQAHPPGSRPQSRIMTPEHESQSSMGQVVTPHTGSRVKDCSEGWKLGSSFTGICPGLGCLTQVALLGTPGGVKYSEESTVLLSWAPGTSLLPRSKVPTTAGHQVGSTEHLQECVLWAGFHTRCWCHFSFSGVHNTDTSS